MPHEARSKCSILALAARAWEQSYNSQTLLMLGSRACHILSSASGSSTLPSGSRVAAGTARLSTTERLARWKVMVLKLFWVLRCFQQKRAAQAALGTEPYKRIFNKYDKMKTDGQTAPTQVINGEAVGKPLPDGTGTRTVEANVCQHPLMAMKARGNKTQKWWTCNLCQSRWERVPLDLPAPTMEPRDIDVMQIGKYQGKTFQEIYETQGHYCQWVLQTVDCEPSSSQHLKRLASYIVSREQREAHAQIPSSAPQHRMDQDSDFEYPSEHSQDSQDL